MRARHRFLASIICLGCLAASVGLSQSAKEPSASDPADQLITKLGSKKFAEREKAARTLDEMGPGALPALQRAAKNSDPEIRRRAEELGKKIAQRVATEKILEPRRVHLICRDTSIQDAAADLAKQSGITIRLHDPKQKLAGRKITLDTGATTFWMALDALCQEAGLVEVEQASLARGGPGIAPALRQIGGPAAIVVPVPRAVAPPLVPPPAQRAFGCCSASMEW